MDSDDSFNEPMAGDDHDDWGADDDDDFGSKPAAATGKKKSAEAPSAAASALDMVVVDSKVGRLSLFHRVLLSLCVT